MKSVHPPRRPTPAGMPLPPSSRQQFAAVRLELEHGRRKLDREQLLATVSHARRTKSIDLLCDVIAMLVGEVYKDP